MPASGLALPATSQRYAVRASIGTPVPTGRELHLITRFTAGYTPQTLRQLRRAGGHRQWFEKQLRPGKVKEPRLARDLPSWFPAMSWSLGTKAARNQSGEYMAWEHARDLGNLSMLRRMYTRRQVLEQLVDFWSNHLHIPAGHDLAWIHRKAYDDLLRRYALTSFETLLVNATLHPSMLLYLDNFLSERDAPNENHGRELLELHTVGREAGYTEPMVKDSARILSGYTVHTDNWEGYYDPERHTTGKVKVLGFTHANASADGRAVTVAYLRYLANHPSTARRICQKLAVRFVSDTPSDALVDSLAKTYLRSGTSIKAVLRALVASPEFWAARNNKVRTPYDDLVATFRALGIKAGRPVSDESCANVLNWVHGSPLVYQWPTPDGAPDNAVAWTSVSRMLSSFRYHWGLAGGYWPTRQVSYRGSAAWLPQGRTQVRFDELVDHLSRTILGRRSTSRLLEAACQATNQSPATTVDAQHAVLGWMFPRLATVLLDSPKHLSR